MNILEFGYLGLAAKDVEAWTPFAENYLGLQTRPVGQGHLGLRMDERLQRLLVTPSDRDGFGYLGLRIADADAMDEAIHELEAAGIRVTPGSASDCELRGVVEMVHFKDPDGNRLELFHSPELAETPFTSPRPIGGFKTGDLGFGHVALNTANMPAMEHFYLKVLGFRLSDYMHDDLDVRWLHVNPRHHSMALVGGAGPNTPVFHHFMIEYVHLDDVGRLYDIALRKPETIGTTLGRHSNDHMLSFYTRSPSGFLVESGWGGRLIDDMDNWQPQAMFGMSLWGHDRTWMPEDLRVLMQAHNDFAARNNIRAPVAAYPTGGFDISGYKS